MALKQYDINDSAFINISELPIDKIKPSPYQQRKYFDFYSLNRLADSIKKYGVLQPITVRLMNGNSYELISGERRLRAAKAVGLKTIPAVLMSADEEKSSLMSFIENIQRKNLDFIEEAEGYGSFIEDFGMSIDEISEKTGVNTSVIRKKLKILDLSEEDIRLVRENKLTDGHVLSALKIHDADIRSTVLYDMAEQDMTVKKADDYVEKILLCMRFGHHGQKVKSSFNDFKLFTNSIKQSVDAVRKAGIPAYYDISEKSDAIEINIKIRITLQILIIVTSTYPYIH
mgnify:CR=1 FL=1